MKKLLTTAMMLLCAVAVLSVSCKKGDDEKKVNKDSLENVALKGEIASLSAAKDTINELKKEIADGMNQIID